MDREDVNLVFANNAVHDAIGSVNDFADFVTPDLRYHASGFGE
jgi:hypothetical protein